MSVEPWINWQFHKTPGLIDPRAIFSRAGDVGTVPNRIGLITSAPANTARYRFNPTTGLCEGLLIEPQRTQFLLRSQEFDNASWTKTNLTVTANSAVAPDGTTTADTLAATAADGNVAQAITITAGRGIAYSKWLKAATVSFAQMSLSDGTNTAKAWFNLASGAVGSSTAGGSASGTSLLYSQHWIEVGAQGFYRCAVEVTSSVATAITCATAPCAADSAASANGNSVYAWGAQGEAEATLTNATSYMPSTSATVTRNADNLILPVTAAQVPLDRGTMLFEFTARQIPAVTGGQSIVLGGIGDTFDNTIYVTRSSATGLGVAYRVGGVAGGLPSKTCAYVPGTTYRFGLAWTAGRLAVSLDGSAITATTTGIAALASVARIAVGCAPWATVSTTVLSNMVHRAFVYAPVCVSDALLQTLTAP